MNWDGKRVTLYSKWEEGGEAFLVAPNERHPEFTLQAVDGSSPTTYTIQFTSGYMYGSWRDCSPLVEMGTANPPDVTDFPELNESDPDLDNKCHEALWDVIADLRNDHTQMKRLEGKMPVIFKGMHYVDRVRMTWLKGVVPVAGGLPNDDLVVIDLVALSGGPQENGGASGPPH